MIGMKVKLNRYIKKYGYIWIVFLVAFLPRFLFLFNTYTLSISGDELFAMWPAAKIVGYDWSGVMEDYRYYGYGYSVLLIPFFALIKNPVVLYRSLVLIMILAQSLSAPICCHLMKKYFEIDNKTVLCLTGIACSYLVAVRAVYTYPEFIYTFLIWLIVWGLLKLVKCSEKQKLPVTILVIILATYAFTVHSRGIAIWIALCGIIVFYAWVYHKTIVNLKSILICTIFGILCYVGARGGIQYVLNYIGGGMVTEVSNTSVNVSASLFTTIKDSASWTTWLNIIMGQLNEALINTGGIAAAIVIVLVVLLWNAFLRKKEIVELEDAKEQRSFDYKPYIVVSTFCLCTVAITIGGQSFTWLGGALRATQGGNPDSFRAFTYFRYYGAYVGPLLMCGIAYFTKKKELLDWVKGKAVFATVMLQGYWVLCIIPLIGNFSGCVWSYAPYSLTKGFRDVIRIRSYIPGTLVIFLVLGLSYLLIKKKKERWILGILCLILIYSYGYNALYHEGDRGKKNYEAVIDGCNMIKKMQENGEEIEELYVEKTQPANGGQTITYTYQYNLPEISVISGVPSVEKENAVFICVNAADYEYLLEEGYKLIKIADSQYMYVLGVE